jgi:hypothetical protein
MPFWMYAICSAAGDEFGLKQCYHETCGWYFFVNFAWPAPVSAFGRKIKPYFDQRQGLAWRLGSQLDASSFLFTRFFFFVFRFLLSRSTRGWNVHAWKVAHSRSSQRTTVWSGLWENQLSVAVIRPGSNSTACWFGGLGHDWRELSSMTWPITRFVPVRKMSPVASCFSPPHRTLSVTSHTQLTRSSRTWRSGGFVLRMASSISRGTDIAGREKKKKIFSSILLLFVIVHLDWSVWLLCNRKVLNLSQDLHSLFHFPSDG